jgi:hypothetical protein
MQGHRASVFHPAHGKAGGRRSICSQRLATPKEIQATRGSQTELGATRMEKIGALMAEFG